MNEWTSTTSVYAFLTLAFSIVLGVPKTTPKFSDSLGGLTGHSIYIWSYSWLWFITVTGFKAKSAKGKDAWGEVQRKPGTSFQESYTCRVTQDSLILPAWNYSNTCEMLFTREIIRDCPGLWLGAGHTGTLYLVCIRTKSPRRKTGVQHKSHGL